jgi:hypothetical protein
MNCGSMSMFLGVVLNEGIARGEEDTVLEAHIAECTQAANDCLERLAAFEQHDPLPAIQLSLKLGQADRAHVDALEFLDRFSQGPHVGEAVREALLLGGLIEAVAPCSRRP